jgi:hypothetical protein
MAAETGRSGGRVDDAIKNFPSVFGINLAGCIKNPYESGINLCHIVSSNPVDF